MNVTSHAGALCEQRNSGRMLAKYFPYKFFKVEFNIRIKIYISSMMLHEHKIQIPAKNLQTLTYKRILNL